MFNKIGSGAAALGMLAAASSPALAERAEKSNQAIQLVRYTVEKVDCVTHVKNERAVRKEAGSPMSRKEQKVMLLDCRADNAEAVLDAQDKVLAELDAEIAEQDRILTELDKKLDALNIRINDSGQILDEYNRVVAQLVMVGNQLQIQRKTNADIEAQNGQIEGQIATLDADTASLNVDTARLNADTQSKLDQAEAILLSLASQGA